MVLFAQHLHLDARRYLARACWYGCHKYLIAHLHGPGVLMIYHQGSHSASLISWAFVTKTSSTCSSVHKTPVPVVGGEEGGKSSIVVGHELQFKIVAIDASAASRIGSANLQWLSGGPFIHHSFARWALQFSAQVKAIRLETWMRVFYRLEGAGLGSKGLPSVGKRASSPFEIALRMDDWTEIQPGERDEESHASTIAKAPTVSISI
ncbi:hypothetical protein EDD18DRAFT_1108361 [Armillaria luteobubalina]|uniref:Uncharacterized protein n=1 Tax=Armillaria luteobubalina TaxID=153913 RepID=A0AA39ULN1_9AGAR|nr:hypothetical protein EDD18DRAFT_1108361 [Armillaria luteobubalina]